jgi:hypothetical protein
MGALSQQQVLQNLILQHECLSVASWRISCNGLLLLLLPLLLPLRMRPTSQVPCTAHMEPLSTG